MYSILIYKFSKIQNTNRTAKIFFYYLCNNFLRVVCGITYYRSWLNLEVILKTTLHFENEYFVKQGWFENTNSYYFIFDFLKMLTSISFYLLSFFLRFLLDLSTVLNVSSRLDNDLSGLLASERILNVYYSNE